MKEIFDWVSWFRALSRKIATEGPAFLVRKAREVEWSGKKPPPLVNGDDEWIDPFSFLYTLAQKCTAKQRPKVYPSVHRVVDIRTALPDPTRGDLYILPIPPAIANARFHDGTSEHYDRLWRLFRQAISEDDPISAANFEKVLGINGVAATKLSHGLFLANPHRFLPIDGFPALKNTLCATDLRGQLTYEAFEGAIERVQRCFPGCQPFEINYFLYFQGDGGWISKESAIFQIATRLDDHRDFWSEFEENNWVRTSGKASGVPWDQPLPEGKKAYPVREPKDGDIVLVRYGKRGGRAIGIVAQNDYTDDDGLHERSRIHVGWINKTHAQLRQDCPIRAMSRVKRKAKGAYAAFRNSPVYEPTIELIHALGAQKPNNGPVREVEHVRNQILYGPPGTGKTWSTVSRAVAIVEGMCVEDVEREDRDSVKARFDEHREAGQVAVATFHQNYAYEDFMEGIRPAVGEDGADRVVYQLRPGVFREVADRATENLRLSERSGDDSWHVDRVLQGFLDWIEERTAGGDSIALPREGKVDLLIMGVYRGKSGDIAGVEIGGPTEQKLFRKVLARDYPRFPTEIKSYQDIKPTQESKSPWHGQAIYFYEVLKRMKEYHDDNRASFEPEAVSRKNFVLIIDEINRGNIARIFGELITLVEDSRRIGGSDATTVTLPYSGDEFGVPKNLHIIGTMNTADRSIALLDTALRRRFEFVEMMPDSSLIGRSVEGVDLGKLLDAMNDRIRFLLDREHQIGHTYLLAVNDRDGLRKTFQNRIVPLLQEYFYDDWAKIAAVLADNGFIRAVPCPEELKERELVDSDAEAWELADFDENMWGEADAYRQIYAGKADKGAPAEGGQPKEETEAGGG